MVKVRALIMAAGAAALGALAPGCTDAGTSLLIVQNQVPDDGCVVPNTQSSNFRSRGRIDVNASEGYLFTPLVESLVTDSATGQGTRLVQVEGADVDLTFGAGFDASGIDSSLTSFSQAFSGSITPGGSAGFSVIVIPKPLLDQMAGQVTAGATVQVTAKVVVFGTLDGGDVKSNPFNYPVDVCDGCTQVDNGLCADLPTGFTAKTGGVCNQLQDDPIDCCTDDTGATVCPAVPPPAA